MIIILWTSILLTIASGLTFLFAMYSAKKTDRQIKELGEQDKNFIRELKESIYK